MTRASARCIVIFVCLASWAVATDRRVVPPQSRRVVMIDGKLNQDEWKDSSRIEVPGLANLYFKQAAGYVFIAVEYAIEPSGIVDLYVEGGDGQIYDLHASAKLGERKLHGNNWPDWTWWNNRGWVANVSRVDSWEQRTFLPEPVREYQIARSRFPARVWRLRFELTPTTEKTAKPVTTIFPANTTDKDPRNWLLLDLKQR